VNEPARALGKRLGLLPLLVVLALLLLWPLAHLVQAAFAAEDGPWAAFAELWTTTRYRRAVVGSLILAGSAAAVATLACLPVAWLLARRDFPGRGLLRALFAVPMAFSGIVVGFLAVLMMGRSGLLPRLSEWAVGEPVGAGLAYTLTGLVIAYLWFEIPRAVLTLEGALVELDARLLDAARNLGAGGWLRLRAVTLPLLLPALASTFAVTFAAALGSFGVALIASVRRLFLLPLELFGNLFTPPPDWPVAAAMGCTLIVLALGVTVLARLLARRYEVVP